jgi:hypothetical protein
MQKRRINSLLQYKECDNAINPVHPFKCCSFFFICISVKYSEKPLPAIWDHSVEVKSEQYKIRTVCGIVTWATT